MDLKKKYITMIILGVAVIVLSAYYFTGGYFKGLFHGIGVVFMVYGFYNSITMSLTLRKEADKK